MNLTRHQTQMQCISLIDAVRRAQGHGFNYAIFQAHIHANGYKLENPVRIHACRVRTLRKKLESPIWRDYANTKMAYHEKYTCSILHPVAMYDFDILFTDNHKLVEQVQDKVKRFGGANPGQFWNFPDWQERVNLNPVK